VSSSKTEKNICSAKYSGCPCLLLGFTADLILPLAWSIAATVPIMLLCWWLAYRSEWFE